MSDDFIDDIIDGHHDESAPDQDGNGKENQAAHPTGEHTANFISNHSFKHDSEKDKDDHVGSGAADLIVENDVEKITPQIDDTSANKSSRIFFSLANRLPVNGRKILWETAEKVYGVAHVMGNHWVLYELDLSRELIEVYDSLLEFQI